MNRVLGTRIKLICIKDIYTNLKLGDEGTVVDIDDAGTLHVKWDNGSTLGLVPGIDKWGPINLDKTGRARRC